MNCDILVICYLIIGFTSAQDGIEFLNERIQDVFGDTGNRAGFDTVVTPEPLIPNSPTQFPTILQNNNGPCKCVPYWMCDPGDNGVVTSDNRINTFGEIDVRYNPESCQDVLDVCCADSKLSNIPVTPSPLPLSNQRPRGCGIRNVGGIDFSIAGNVQNEAGFGEFPWTVALLSQSECLCGGSLIHPNVILTGAHCVFNLTTTDLKIRAGEWDTQTTKERLPFQERDVANIIIHPNFNLRSLANDVALLYLQQPVQLDDHINVVCLPSQNYISYSRDCFASGWGKNVFGREGQYSVIMKRIPLPMVDYDTCQEELRKTRLSNHFNLHSSFVCAGGEEGIDTCQGDGGSPLVCPIGVNTDNRYVQVGTVAWGIGCNDKIPAVYANVAQFRTWIDEQVRLQGYDTSGYSF